MTDNAIGQRGAACGASAAPTGCASNCKASGIDLAFFREPPEDNVAALINEWYRLHIADGGPADATQEELIAEALAEEALGGGFSYPPGRA